MKANLHLHSRYSDGTAWPAEIVRDAARIGLQYIALTDHDTMGGIREFKEACDKESIATIAACEIDCHGGELKYNSELLAYFPDGNPARETAKLTERLVKARENLMHEYLETARRTFRTDILRSGELKAWKENGILYPERAGTISWNKVDIFNYLKRKDIVKETTGYGEFKKKYFETGTLGVTRDFKVSCESVIKTVRADGGVVVIPHIGHEFGDSIVRMDSERKRLKDMLSWFWETGARGVELYFYRNKPHALINELVRSLAEGIGYFFTYGSDCHGPDSGKYTIDRFSGEMPEIRAFIQ